jgi:hypothetical protein
VSQPPKDPAEELLTTWLKQFNAQDLDAICSLYSTEAVLWGTYAADLITEPEGIRRYFSEAFRQGLRAEAVQDTLHTQSFEPIYVCSGAYVVTKESVSGSAEYPARFTLVVAAVQGQWRIVNHHSSLNPARTRGA